MDLELSPEHEAFKQEVRVFLALRGDQAPSERDTRLKSAQRQAWQQLLLERGYIARTVSKEYGGFGAQPDVLKLRILADWESPAQMLLDMPLHIPRGLIT